MSEALREVQAALLDAIEDVLISRGDAQYSEGSDPVACVDYATLLELEDAYDAYMDAVLDEAAADA